MNAQDTRQFLQRYFEAVASDIDTALEKFVADDSLKEHGRFFQNSFPGYRVEPIETVAEGNKIAVYAMFHGVHSGPLQDIAPTGKEVAAPFMIIYIIEDEKIVGHHITINEAELLRQLGVLPATAPA